MSMPDESEQLEQNPEEDMAIEEEQYVEGEDGSAEKVLRQKLAECRKEKNDYLLGWQRCKADTVNLRQQEEAKRRDSIQFATEDLINALLPVLDTLDHALRGKKSDDPYVQGFGHIGTQLLSILADHGLTRISETDVPCDLSRHEPVETIRTETEEEDNIVQEIVEHGYLLNGKILKPAKVKIAEYKNES